MNRFCCVGSVWPLNCHPPATRIPLPIDVYVAASVDDSNVVFHNSGPAPLRDQVTTPPPPVTLSSWTAAPVLVSRAMLLRNTWPFPLLNPVKPPPTRTLPSACIARAPTTKLAPGLKLGSIEPSTLRRPRLPTPAPPS